ncbi:radical SAM protein [Dysgonomonas sp.]
MFYKLKDNYALRGWSDLEYAIVDFYRGEIQFLNKFIYTVLSLCNGNVDSAMMLPSQLKIIEILSHTGIIEELPESKPIAPEQYYKKVTCRYMSTAHWSITGKCNLRCIHCYMSAPQAKYGELTTEQCFEIIEKLRQANIYKVSLTGGEPLVRKDFWEIVDKLIDSKIFIHQIYTNGVLVNDRFIQRLKKRNIYPEISISYDGFGYHDWIRGVDGIEKKVLKAIDTLVKEGFDVSIEMSLNRKNISSLSKSVFLMASLGVSNIKATPTSNSGNWIGENESYTLTCSELYDAYLAFIKDYKMAGAPIDIMLGGFFACRKGEAKYVVPFEKYKGVEPEKIPGMPVCGSARKNMYIAADGKVLPCIPLSGLPIQDTMPDITKVDLIDVLGDSSYISAITTEQKEIYEKNKSCSKCKYKLLCGGGCRAGALISDNDYLGKDASACYFFKNDYRQKIEKIYSKTN